MMTYQRTRGVGQYDFRTASQLNQSLPRKPISAYNAARIAESAGTISGGRSEHAVTPERRLALCVVFSALVDCYDPKREVRENALEFISGEDAKPWCERANTSPDAIRALSQGVRPKLLKKALRAILPRG